ncbi:MAG: hypothetical protein EAZ92_12450 [Candidatus Kapaibacterium sp.]|nr:MAG: hypothetical protein EAZ92_12450 [Candidatus Kapabacteria bacterium]
MNTFFLRRCATKFLLSISIGAVLPTFFSLNAALAQAPKPAEMPLIATPEVRSDSLDFVKFPPAKDVTYFGIGLWGAAKGTINTVFRSENPSYTPTASIAGDRGFNIDFLPQVDFGITLMAPALIGETVGLNLDLGLANYNFGTQLFPRYILNSAASAQYLDAIGRNLSAADRFRAETARFFTNVQVLSASPMLNIGGLLLGVNVGIPLPFLASTIQTEGGGALNLAAATETIAPEKMQIFWEPRLGLQVPIIKIRGTGTLFFNANLSYTLPGNSPLTLDALNSMNAKVQAALTRLGYDSTTAYRYPLVAQSSGRDSGRTRFDPISVQPFSASVGLSFVLSAGNNNDLLNELQQEERRTDSLRVTNAIIGRTVDNLRQRSIGLADKAINTVVLSSKMADRLAALEKNQLEQQKTALKTELVDTKKKVFQALFTTITGTNEDGSETAENPTVRIEQYKATATKTLLPSVYFDQGSALLSTRYKRIQAAERESYKLPSDALGSSYSLYPNLLNIIGKRAASSQGKITLTGTQSSDETDTKLAETRVETLATYLQDIWKIPASRLNKKVNKGTGSSSSSSAQDRRVDISSENADITAPLGMDYTARLANPPVVNIGIDISTGAGLKQWELEIQQIVNNQGVVLKDTNGGANYPPRFVWRLNEEPATMPQSSEPVSMRLGAFDINNAAAPDAPLKTLKVEQITLEQKRANKRADKSIQQFEFVVVNSLTDLDAASNQVLAAAKAALSAQSRVHITVYGGNTNFSARSVAQALGLDDRNAILRDAGTPLLTSQLPEASVYNRAVRIRIETPSGN